MVIALARGTLGLKQTVVGTFDRFFEVDGCALVLSIFQV